MNILRNQSSTNSKPMFANIIERFVHYQKLQVITTSILMCVFVVCCQSSSAEEFGCDPANYGGCTLKSSFSLSVISWNSSNLRAKVNISISGTGYAVSGCCDTRHIVTAMGIGGSSQLAVLVCGSPGCNNCDTTVSVSFTVDTSQVPDTVVKFWIVSNFKTLEGYFVPCYFSDTTPIHFSNYDNISPESAGLAEIKCPDQVGDPIGATNGNMNFTRTDVAIGTDYGPEIQFIRSYNSGGDTSTSGPLQPKWTHNYAEHLSIDSSGDVTYFDGGGRQVFIRKRMSINTYENPDDITIYYESPMAFGFLLDLDTSSNEYSLRIPGDSKRIFNSSGKLLSIADVRNKKIRFIYNGNFLDSVKDASGRFLTFHYDGNDKLEFIKQKGDTTLVTFQYDGSSGDTLQKVTYYDGSWETYEYIDSGGATWLLSQVTTSDSVQYFFEYDSLSRGTSSYLRDNVNKYDVAYSTTDTTEQEEFKYITKTYYGEDSTIYESVWLPDQSVRSRKTSTNSGCLSCGTEYEYDELGNLKLTTYANGRMDSVAYSDSTRQILSYTKAYGDSLQHTTNFEYGTDLFLLTKSWDSSLFGGIRSTEYFYDSTNGKLDSIKSVVKEGASTTQTLVTKFLYNDSLQVRKIDGPRTAADTLGFIYYSNRDLKAIRRPNGDSTSFGQRNNLGQRTTITDGNDITTAFVYDKRGRLIHLIHGLGDVDSLLTSYTYTFSGKIKSVTFPMGNSLTYTYDKHDWLVAIENNAGDSIAYGYDSLSNRTSQKIYSSDDTLRKSENYVFNEKAQLVKVISAASDTSAFFYDDMGNLDKLMDANHDTTRYVYDQLNRLDSLIQFLDGTKITTQLDYDKHDNMIKAIDPEAEQNSYTYDDRGLLLYDSSGVTGPASYKYDSSGNLIEKLNSMVDTTYFYYDDLNRLTHVQYDDFDDHVYYYYDDPSFNRIGRLYKEQTSTCSTVYKYDWPGIVSEERLTYYGDSKLYKTTIDYDKNGNVTLITYPSGAGIWNHYDSMDNVVKIEAWYDGELQKVLADSIKYMPFGRQRKWKLGNGIWVNNIFDQRYLVDSITNGSDNVMKWDYTVNKVGNVEQIKNIVDNAQTKFFEYDDIGRLTRAQCQDYLRDTMRFVYLKNGNRDSLWLSSGAHPIKYKYAYSDNKLDSLWQSTQKTKFKYNTIGNAVKKQVGISTDTTFFTYDGTSQLVSTSFQTSSTYFAYDARRRRVKTTTGATGTKYINNSSGQILSEFQLDGTRIYDYVYLNGTLLAKLAVFEDPNCVHDTIIDLIYGGYGTEGDSLGEGGITESSGPGNGGGGGCDSILVAYYFHIDHLGTPWYITSSNKSVIWNGRYLPFGDLYQETINMGNLHRFPGQYQWSPTLYYNWHRFYDPTLGRYLQADPIGLEGGMNLYSYAESNPLYYMDQLGLRIDWGPYYITNPSVRRNIILLNEAIVNSGFDDNSFTIRVTGGDRYIGPEGIHYSLHEHEPIPESDVISPHLLSRGAIAVDFQLEGIGDPSILYDPCKMMVFEKAVKHTQFDPGKTRPRKKGAVYTDPYDRGHIHVSLPNDPRYKFYIESMFSNRWRYSR